MGMNGFYHHPFPLSSLVCGCYNKFSQIPRQSQGNPKENTTMDKAAVKKIATLARLDVTEADQEKYATQLSGILKWVEQLNEVDTANVAPLSSVVDTPLSLRPDIVNDGGIQSDILANAPESTEGFFVVPKVVE